MPDSEQIIDPGRVTRLLERLARRYTPLSVKVSGHEELYTSCIVGVDGSYVLMDELLPTGGHQLLLAERRLEVEGKLDGIDIQFTTTLKRVDDQDNVLTYCMNLPARLEYRQRRQAYRVHIPMTRKLSVIIENPDDTAVEGLLYDLSHGGAGIIFPAGKIIVEPGQLRECAIELPDDAWLYCAVELRYAKETSSRDRQHIGARFSQISPAQAQLVGTCINELEREFIRKRAAD